MEENTLSEKHIPVLDGLRGFAILYVMFYHFIGYATRSGFLSAFSSFGFSGVDLFFVLSGFLITGILIKSKTEKNYFRNFYVRRFLRIFPLYYSMLFVFIIVVPHIGYFKQFNYFWLTDGTHYPFWLFIMNFPAVHVAVHPFLAQAWSLSIEEQYYLFIPAIVYFLSKDRLLYFLLIVFTTSFLGRIISYSVFNVDASYLYHFTLTHLDGIALGGIIRLSFEYPHLEKIRQHFAFLFPFLAVLMTGLVIYCRYIDIEPVHLFCHPAMITVGYLLSSLTYGSLLMKCLISKNVIGFFFSNSFLRMTGKYSYAMYLFHTLAINIAQAFLAKGFLLTNNIFFRNGWVHVSGGILITYLMAITSWYVLEKPVMRLKRKFN